MDQCKFIVLMRQPNDHITEITAAGIGNLNPASWQLSCHLSIVIVFCSAHAVFP